MIGMPKPYIAPEVQEIWKAPIGEFVPNPNNPRRYYDQASLSALTVSIGQLGIQVPLRVRIVQHQGLNKLLILSGHRRYLAARQAGLTELPYILFEGDETQMLYLEAAENLARDDLNPYDELITVLKLVGHQFERSPEQAVELLKDIYAAQRRSTLSEEEADWLDRLNALFKTIGYKLQLPTVIKTRLPLLSWPSELLNLMQEGRMSFSNAQLLSKLPAATRAELLQEAETLSFDDLTVRIKALSASPTPPAWEGWKALAKVTKAHPQPPQHLERLVNLTVKMAATEPSWHTVQLLETMEKLADTELNPQQQKVLSDILGQLSDILGHDR